ncbi:MAG: HU family DNA-binding protein [Clostridia bacterium]|nr:HU family DNA-binding protein [Clostridia bacterium]
MNKSELIVALAQKAELSKKDAEKAVNAFVEVVTETLKAGDKVQLVGFGTFESKARPARTARNPRTGEEIKIAASKTAAFKVGKGLKDSIN